METSAKLRNYFHDNNRIDGVHKDSKQIAAFISENIDALLMENKKRIADIVLKIPEDTQVSERVREYCPDAVLDSIRRCININSQSCRPLLPSNIYCATRYDHVTCHRLFFGEPRPATLYGQAKVFMQYYLKQDPADKEKLVELLTSGVLKTNNPYYVLKERLKELAYQKGLSLNSFLAFSSFLPSVRVKVSRFAIDDITPELTPASNWDSNSIPFRLAMCISVIYGISVDQLLLQDYSHLAVMDGMPLTANQQKALSAFLCASPEAKVSAISYMIFHGLS